MSAAQTAPPYLQPDGEHHLVLNKFILYETRTRFFIVGSNQSDERFRVLKIDRTDGNELNIIDDEVVYTKVEIQELLTMIETGNKSSGGLHKVASFFGIVGFIRFLEGYYIILIVKRSPVALIGGHYIYHIDDTMAVSVPGPGAKLDKKADEARYVQVFGHVDLSKNFYFSYTYDITRTLQWNLSSADGKENFEYNDMFVWNSYLLRQGMDSMKSDWVLPIIHGFVDQSKISVYGRSIYVALIARRSRYFAGARFLKRGVNDQGYVANDVETEQIVSDATTTSFYHPPGRYGTKPGYTSFVQHRGSIPLFWSQETAGMVAKPPIELNVIDPYFSAAALHFDNMFLRYGGPIIVLNLVKSKEKNRRESILLDEFTEAVSYLNQFLPPDKKIKYIAWDMARASKSHDQDVIGVLENLGEEVLETTGFFHSGPEPYQNALHRALLEDHPDDVVRIMGRRQHGVVRTNCIDCLDRTNAAQFVIGKCALGYQLYALGVLEHPSVPFDTDAINLLNAMYHDHGDTIALQYGGSHLVNTMETYRKISPWTSHSRDMIESIRRYYSNSFTDAEKQEAINLFLGHFVPHMNVAAALWDLSSDYYLHHEEPRKRRVKRSYTHWYTDDAMKLQQEHSAAMTIAPVRGNAFYVDYYRIKLYTSFSKLFAFNMISTSTRLPTRDDVLDHSPFTVRVNPAQSNRYLMIYSLNIGGVRRWLKLTNNHSHTTRQDAASEKARNKENIGNAEGGKSSKTGVIKESSAPWWTTSALATRLVDPQVPTSELKEYKRYVHQFKAASALLTPTVDLAPHTQASHADYPIFEEYVSRTTPRGGTSKSRSHFAGSSGPLSLNVDSRDEALYVHYVDNSSRTANYVGPGVARSDVPKQTVRICKVVVYWQIRLIAA
ncbi:Sac phosphatase domain-containing protein [Fimicolochytrium jonesii]|uniref:Sac phosphatase domain-containing protein n=1 Tax=Fimicolochytrium jonesii TaxID=1396493 RepID=UPI0022FE4E29|nr:Sac phosphatase domain-containing protein [Fimicolochytrium jonesii]XP_052923397.1 Sac phosphatase domain-containing protein [Fimicolochytrium jonesii]KAI8815982.1 SacI homology domain-containing protein [Fimicolochytrium jonesii]KAI8818429.1 SacI homology domain-containing protein [Fimicolochytrium jonesii]